MYQPSQVPNRVQSRAKAGSRLETSYGECFGYVVARVPLCCGYLPELCEFMAGVFQ